MDFTPAVIALVLGALVSLLTTYVPGFNAWFASFSEDMKKAITGAAMIVIGIIVYVLACTPSLGFTYVACPAGGIWTLVAIILGALTGSQVTDRVSPEPRSVKLAKAESKAVTASATKQ